jgi:hypothetical protein
MTWFSRERGMAIMESITKWKWILITAALLAIAVVVILPGHPSARAANDRQDDFVATSYDTTYQTASYSVKPSPFPAIPVKQYRPAPRAAAPLPDSAPRVTAPLPPGITFPSATPK